MLLPNTNKCQKRGEEITEGHEGTEEEAALSICSTGLIRINVFFSAFITTQTSFSPKRTETYRGAAFPC